MYYHIIIYLKPFFIFDSFLPTYNSSFNTYHY